MKITKILAILSIPVGLSAQDKTLDWYLEKFPKEQAVKLREETNIAIELDDEKGLIIERELLDQKLLLTNAAASYNDRQIVYGSFFEITDIEAASYLPKGKSYTRKKVKDFRTEKIMSERVFHDDLKAIKFEYGELRAGAKVELRYKEQVLNPRFLPPVYLQDILFSENIKVTLKLPKSVHVKIVKHHVNDEDLIYSEEEKNGFVTRTWQLKDVKQMPDEDGAPDMLYYIPHLSFIIESYEQDDQNITVLKGVADLYSWYSGLLDSVDNQLTPALKQTVDSITKTHQTELEQAQALFNWVRHSIKYVAVEDGLGGFIPDNPSAVSHKRFGDCKGMSCLLANLMRYAGLNAHECWIGTRDIPYNYTEIYTPLADNHMITAYNHQGTWYFLDPTDQYVPFGYPSAFIQGKEALIGIDKPNFSLQRVPIMKPQDNLSKAVDTIKVVNTDLMGKGLITHSGYAASRFKRLYKRAEKKDRFYKYFLESGNDKFSVLGEPEVRQTDTVTQIKYAYKLPDYLRLFDDRMLVNLNTERVFASSHIEERTLPLERDYAQTFEYSHYLVIPDGYKLLNKPNDLTISSDWADVKLTYEDQGQTIKYHLKVEVKPVFMQADGVDEWNKVVKKLRGAYRKNIELQKI